MRLAILSLAMMMVQAQAHAQTDRVGSGGAIDDDRNGFYEDNYRGWRFTESSKERMFNQKIKECTWKLFYSTRLEEHDDNYKNKSKVLVPWPTESKNMFLSDDGFQMGRRGAGKIIFDGGPYLKHPEDIAVAMKILGRYLKGYLDNLGGNINSYIVTHRKVSDRILKEEEVKDIRDALCTCENLPLLMDDVKKSRDQLFNSNKNKPFRVEIKKDVRSLHESDFACETPVS